MDMLMIDPTHLNYSPQNHVVLLQDFRSEPCQVCGENASGWHCGAVTCEACKKFFLRSVHEEYLKYKCIREKKCVITRTTRTQCQYCRYAKCLQVGMKLSEGSPNPKIEDIFQTIPCAICQDPSSGIHFGVTTCEGCKGFFRRTLRDNVPPRFKCAEQNNCVINTMTRNSCRACRFRKCIDAGMSIEGSRIGRQSNLFKHKIVELQRKGLIGPHLLNMLANPNNRHGSHRSHPSTRKKSGQRSKKQQQEGGGAIESDRTLCLEEKLDGHVLQQILQIENAYLHHLKHLPICQTETNDYWFTCLYQLDEYTVRVTEFAEKIPGFFTLNPDDKALLIQSSTHSVILFCFCLNASRASSMDDSQWNYFNVPMQSSLGQHLQQTFPSFFHLNHLTYAFEKELQLLQLDEKEIALVTVLLITSIVNSKLNDFQRIEQIQDEFFSILFDYMAVKRGINSKDYFLITIQIPFLHRINSILSANILNFKYS